MLEEADFNQYVDEFNKTNMELDSLEVKIEEEDKILLLLALLPSSFANLMTTILFRKETLTFNEVFSLFDE